MRVLAFLLLLAAFAAPSASAQRGTPVEIPVQKMGNFEIQDLMIHIRYAEGERDGDLMGATVTARAARGRLRMQQLYLGGALGGEEIATIALRDAGDGTLVGRGSLPPLSKLESLQLRMGPRSTQGFNIGMPPTLRDAPGTASGEGWKIEVSMDWPLDVDIVIEG